MDVTAPPRPPVSTATPPPRTAPDAPSPKSASEQSLQTQALPVQQAPDAPAEVSQQDQADQTTSTDISQDTTATQEDATPVAPQATQPKDTTPLPVGAIVTTIICMIALSALAVMIYLKTQ